APTTIGTGEPGNAIETRNGPGSVRVEPAGAAPGPTIPADQTEAGQEQSGQTGAGDSVQGTTPEPVEPLDKRLAKLEQELAELNRQPGPVPSKPVTPEPVTAEGQAQLAQLGQQRLFNLERQRKGLEAERAQLVRLLDGLHEQEDRFLEEEEWKATVNPELQK